MFAALQIGATGMQAQQLNVETIASNLANINTPGYRKGRVGFADLIVSDSKSLAPASLDQGLPIYSGLTNASLGVTASFVERSFELGELKKTEQPLDVAIRGSGFFEVSMPDGSIAFSRGGSLQINKDGLLADASGHPIRPGIFIPKDAQAVQIATDGVIFAKTGNSAGFTEIGRLELTRFTNLQKMQPMGEQLFRPSVGAGDPISARPGEEGMGSLAPGYLESSNVKMVDEMVNLMVAQRAYESNVKVVQAADDILGMVNGLRR